MQVLVRITKNGTVVSCEHNGVCHVTKHKPVEITEQIIEITEQQYQDLTRKMIKSTVPIRLTMNDLKHPEVKETLAREFKGVKFTE